MPGPEEPGQRDDDSGEPADLPGGQDHDVDPAHITMRPAMATATATYPTRRAQTATLQGPLCCNWAGSSMP